MKTPHSIGSDEVTALAKKIIDGMTEVQNRHLPSEDSEHARLVHFLATAVASCAVYFANSKRLDAVVRENPEAGLLTWLASICRQFEIPEVTREEYEASKLPKALA